MPAETSAETSAQLGKRIEDIVCRYLGANGLQLLERNYHGPRGEIDLIMRHAGGIVFVEIRYRRGTRFGSGAESVDRRKRTRLVTTALHYLQAHKNLAEEPSRFDVVSVAPDGEGYRIQWIQDAFQA
jgi:putative endonuclease